MYPGLQLRSNLDDAAVIVASPNLVARAFTFAYTSGLPSIYDSLYVVLADLLDVELWTADQRLLDALGSNAPRVRFIGNYPL